MSTKLLRFYLLFAGGDWAALGSLKLSCIGLVCPYDDYGTSWWPQGRSAAAHTLLGGRATLLLDLKDTEERCLSTTKDFEHFRLPEFFEKFRPAADLGHIG